MQRYNQRLIEELKNKQTQEKARLPKIQRSDAKTRMAMFKKSLRITGAIVSPEQEREKVKQVSGAPDEMQTTQIPCSKCERQIVCPFSSLQARRRRDRRTRGCISFRNTKTK